jgi:hypothetical protein
MAAATDRFVAWCKQEQASIEQELELLVSGKVRIGEDIGSGWIDKTDEAIERARSAAHSSQSEYGLLPV